MAEGWGCGSCGGSNPDGTRYCGWCGVRRSDEVVEVVDERRLITALFADISGFTTLADGLDVEGLHEVISPVITSLARVAERWGGTIAKYAGDALLVFFGAPVAQEDHAERALHVALEMHEELPRVVESLGIDAHLELHIGVNSGHVVAGMFGGDVRSDYSILGDAVNMAQRLEANAPNGQTYVGESTVLLAGDRFSFESVGELTLKGKPEPVPAWRIAGRRTTPTFARTFARSRFVGRSRELADAATVVGSTPGSGGVIAVIGEPGVGKSRLLAEFRARIIADEITWIDTRCISYGVLLAYWPFVELFRTELGISVETPPEHAVRVLDDASDLTDDAVGYVARLLGIPAPDRATPVLEDPDGFRRNLQHAVAGWLDRRGGGRPLVLAIEDLHWIDDASLALVAHLASACDALSLSVVVSSRPEGDGHVAVVCDASGGAAVRLALQPLDRDAVRELVTDLIGADAPDELVDPLVDRTGGNPFFVREIVRTLIDTGGLTIEQGTAQLPTGWEEALPETVEGVLSARIDRLPRDTIDVLHMAAAIGRRVPLDLLRGIGEEVVDLVTHVERLVSNGVLEPAGDDGAMLLFPHALVLDVAYQRLLRRQRRHLHRRVAEVAEELYGTGDDVVGLMARHLYLAEAGVKAVEYLARAGERDRRLYATSEALVHFRRAVELARRAPRAAGRLPGLLLVAGDLAELLGEYEAARAAYLESLELAVTPRAWQGVASTERKLGACDAALDVVDRAMASPELQGQPLAPLWLERARALTSAGRAPDAVAAVDAALGTLSPDERAGPVAAELLLQRARAEEALARFEDALVHCEEAAAVFAAMGDLRGEMVALRHIGPVLCEVGELDRAATVLVRGLELAERVGAAEEVGACLLNLGQIELRRGDVDAAIAYNDRAVQVFTRIGQRTGLAIATANLAEPLVLAGRLDEAEAHCIAAADLARAIGDDLTLADATCTRAAALLARGAAGSALDAALSAASAFVELDVPVGVARAEGIAAEARDLLANASGARALRARAPDVDNVSISGS